MAFVLTQAPRSSYPCISRLALPPQSAYASSYTGTAGADETLACATILHTATSTPFFTYYQQLRGVASTFRHSFRRRLWRRWSLQWGRGPR